jgi:hypothetical protein
LLEDRFGVLLVIELSASESSTDAATGAKKMPGFAVLD